MLPTNIFIPLTEMADCDVCGRRFPHADRYAAFLPRPSNGEICEIMWACGPDCAKTIGAVKPSEYHRENPDAE